MRSSLPFLSLLAGLTVPGCAEDCDPNAPYVVTPYGGETTKDPEITKKLVAYWAKSTCYKLSDGLEPSPKDQCKDICFPSTGASKDSALGSSYTCNFGNAPWIDGRTGKPLLCGKDKDFQGQKMMTGYCTCDSPILDIAGKFFIDGVIQAGKILEKVICPALQALDIVMAVGMAAIPPPGKVITGGMVAAARSAKAYKYAYEAQDAAQEWADFFLGGMDFAGQAGCPSLIKPSKQDLIARAFQPLSDAPDSIIPGGMDYDSLPCPAKGCRGCKGPKCRNDNKHDDDNASKTGNQPAQTSKASTQGSVFATAKTTGGILSPSNAMISSRWSTVSTLASRSASPVSSSSLSSSSSSSSSSFVVQPTLSCEAVAALDEPELDANNETLKRSYPIDIRSHHFERRGDKHGDACGVELRSFPYPASGAWMREVGKEPKKFGFNRQESCDNYDWDKPDTSSLWDTEHVLEWQTVVAFFNQMNQDIKKDFIHPDPDRNGDKVDFCEYWRESWAFDLAHDQVMADPQAKVSPTPISVSVSSAQPVSQMKPSKTPKPKKRIPRVRKGTPFGWLASQYPHVSKTLGNKWVEEFTLLEKKLNGEYKGKIFSQKEANGNAVSIRSDKTMDALVQGTMKGEKYKNTNAFDQGRAVIQPMRKVIGTLIYMQDKDVAESFAKEKNRMGKMIGYVDKELHKTPRLYFPDKNGNQKQRTASPWKEQGLEDKWTKYMDGVFDGAKEKATKFMDKYLAAMKKEWDSQKKKDEYKKDSRDDAQMKVNKDGLEKMHKDMLALIEKTNKEWDKVKNWQKPANWVSKP